MCTEKKSSRQQNRRPDNFQDPAKKKWVWIGFFVLILGMTPLWPINGTIFGVPKWVVFAVFMGFLASIFIAGVILFAWEDTEDNKK